jgi:hypothetical protein
MDQTYLPASSRPERDVGHFVVKLWWTGPDAETELAVLGRPAQRQRQPRGNPGTQSHEPKPQARQGSRATERADEHQV